VPGSSRRPTTSLTLRNWDASNNGNYLLECSLKVPISGSPGPVIIFPIRHTLTRHPGRPTPEHHFAGVYTGPRNALLYVDGVLAGRWWRRVGISVVQNPLVFGWSDPLYDQGAVDDVRIYDRALSSNDVAVLFSFSAGDTVGDGIPNWWRQQYFGSGTTTNANSCASCDPDHDGYTNLQEYNLGTDPTNSASYPSSIPPNLVGWWKFDEGTGTKQSSIRSGNGNNGVLEGAAFPRVGSRRGVPRLGVR